MTQRKQGVYFPLRCIILNICVFLLYSNLVSCTSNKTLFTENTEKNELPTYILNPSERYPSEEYMASVGNGDSLDDAKQSALHSLSQQLKVEVSGTLKLNSEDSIEDSNEINKFKSTSTLTEDITTSTSQEILGVEFSESYTDSLAQTYIIAYINRNKTGQIYNEKIQSLESEISDLLKASKSLFAFNKYAKLLQAYKLSLKIDIYIETLDVIQPNLAKIAKLGRENTAQQITLELTKTAQSIPLFTETSFRVVSGSVPKFMKQQIQDEVIATLTRMQFTPNTNQALSTAPYIIQTSITWESKPDDKYPNINWSVNSAIKINNQVVISFSEKKQSKGPTIEKASDFAKQDIIYAINKGLENSITNKK